MAGVEDTGTKKKKPKGKGKGKDGKRSQSSPPGTGGGNPSKPLRKWDEIRNYCYYFQKGNCKYQQNPKECPKKHEVLKKDEIAIYEKEIQKARDNRAKSREPSANGRSRGNGKGKGGKGRGKGKGKGKGDRSRSRKRTDCGIDYYINQKGQVEPVCCYKFLNSGKCDNQEKRGTPCEFTHLNKNEKEELTKKLKEILKL